MKLKVTFAAAVAGFLLTHAAAAALAHATLVSSDPPAGGTIKTPYRLSASFDEALTPDGSSIKVQAADGTEVGSGTVSASDDKQMVAELSALPEGQYTVLWTAVTAEDLAVERGTYLFTVSASVPSGSPTVITPGSSAAPSTSTAGGNDLLIALPLAAVIIAAVVGLVLYRNRR